MIIKIQVTVQNLSIVEKNRINWTYILDMRVQEANTYNMLMVNVEV